jgi:hypothetical protein
MKKLYFQRIALCVALTGPGAFVATAAHAEECDAHDDGSVNETRPAKPTGVVEIENVEGDVKVIGWNRAEVNVKGAMDAGCHLDLSPSADRTRVRVTPRERCEANLEIRVPMGSAVEVKTVTADIGVRGVNGAVRIESVSGDLAVAGAPSEVSARTTSGEVDIQATSAVTRARSVSGGVRVRGVRGKATVESVSGECELRGGDFSEAEIRTVSGEIVFEGGLVGQGSFDFKTHSGEVELRLPASTNADFELRSFSGSLETRLGTPKTASSALDFRVGAGGAKVRVRTFSGDVVVDKK